MIVSLNRRRGTRRAAFTLMEVLVVVAILVVLAGAASIAVFKYLDDAKKDRAMVDMKALHDTWINVYLKKGTDEQPTEEDIIQYMGQGPSSLLDPWGNKYTWEVVEGANGDPRPLFTTTAKDGQVLSFPKR